MYCTNKSQSKSKDFTIKNKENIKDKKGQVRYERGDIPKIVLRSNGQIVASDDSSISISEGASSFAESTSVSPVSSGNISSSKSECFVLKEPTLQQSVCSKQKPTLSKNFSNIPYSCESKKSHVSKHLNLNNFEKSNFNLHATCSNITIHTAYILKQTPQSNPVLNTKCFYSNNLAGSDAKISINNTNPDKPPNPSNHSIKPLPIKATSPTFQPHSKSIFQNPQKQQLFNLEQRSFWQDYIRQGMLAHKLNNHNASKLSQLYFASDAIESIVASHPTFTAYPNSIKFPNYNINSLPFSSYNVQNSFQNRSVIDSKKDAIDIDVSKIAGYSDIPLNCPSWKAPIINRKNKKLIDQFLVQLRRGEKVEKEWEGVPEWKVPLIKRQRERKEIMMMEQRIQERHEQKAFEQMLSCPEWKKQLLAKKLNK